MFLFVVFGFVYVERQSRNKDKPKEKESTPNYHKIALNNARVIETFASCLEKRNNKIERLEAHIHKEKREKELLRLMLFSRGSI